MKKLLILTGLLSVFTVNAQRDLTPGKRRGDIFGGAQDFRNLTKHGLQITFGPNYTLTSSKTTEFSGTDANGRPINTIIDPSGTLGGFIDVGMAHYRLKPSRILEKMGKKNSDGFIAKRVKSNLFHRFDWGIGFDYIGGREKTTIELFNPFQELISTEDYKETFYNGYLTGRFTADRFTQVSKRWHLETGIGVNFNYNLLSAEKSGYAPNSIAPLKFQKDFMAQIHLHLAMDYRIRRGDYLSIGFYLPAIGVYEMNKLKPTIQWFSSNYYPLHLQLKWIHHFTKRVKGCNTPGSEDDKKRNEEFLQNN